jgi:hypothetical protein
VNDWMGYESERAEMGGISCLENNSRQPLQEGETISELQGTLVF